MLERTGAPNLSLTREVSSVENKSDKPDVRKARLTERGITVLNFAAGTTVCGDRLEIERILWTGCRSIAATVRSRDDRLRRQIRVE